MSEEKNNHRRHTVVVYNRHALRVARERAAVECATGRQIMTVEQLAARLAGGFLRPIERSRLNEAVRYVIETGELGVLGTLTDFPGFRRALTRSLTMVWTAGLSLEALAVEADTEDATARVNALAAIEQGVLAQLPPSMCRPTDLVQTALERIHHAPRLFGPISLLGFTELAPVWRPLIGALAIETKVAWVAGPRRFPEWLKEYSVELETSDALSLRIRAESCASPRHEVLEAFRWARSLLVQHGVAPHEIAFVTASPDEWDDHVLSLERLSTLPIHFSHGRPALTERDGQLAAALAEVLLRGLSHSRMVRLVGVLRGELDSLKALPANWWRVLPDEAPLLDAVHWRRALDKVKPADFPDGKDHRKPLLDLIGCLCQGLNAAASIGETLLKGTSLSLWRRALEEGPPQALDVALGRIRLDDGTEPGECILWGPADALAATPRPYARLIGLTSRAWPRAAAEDPLLPEHIVHVATLDPLPLHQADRRDFESILRTTETEVVLSRSRRDAGGRQLGPSPLYAPYRTDELYRKRSRTPQHAASKDDRLLARPSEFETFPRAKSAHQCWVDWHNGHALTPHDGLVPARHPVLLQALSRRQSASSLSRLLRDPLGYLWRYALGWDEPSESEEVLTLEPIDFGNLLHSVLEQAVRDLESNAEGLGGADPRSIRAALARTTADVAEDWVDEHPAPPPVLWQRVLDETMALAETALLYPEAPLADQQSFTEVLFGGVNQAGDALRPKAAPWDPDEPVVIPGTDIAIGGYIDRLDLAGDGKYARVTDYKSGRVPKDPPRLKGGAELQRCLYAFAVKALLGLNVGVDTRLLYPKALEDPLFPLEDPEQALEELTAFVREAKALMEAGNALPGAGAEDRYNDHAFALPAGPKASYFDRKRALVHNRLGALTALWEAP